MNLSFNEYQKNAVSTAVYPPVAVVGTTAEPYFQPANYIYPAIGLAGEAGELSEKIKKLVRDKRGAYDSDDVQAISKEIGDILWYCAAISQEFGLDFGAVAQQNLDKLASRKSRGALNGSGDNR